MFFKLRKPGLPPAVYWFAALAFVLRIVVRLHSGIADFWVNGYTFFFGLAQSIAAGKGLSYENGVPTAFRPPVYPTFLAILTMGHQAFWPIAIAQSLVGAGTALCAALLARQMFGGSRGAKAATIATAIVAVYPYYVVHDTALQETGLCTFLTLVAVLAVRRGARAGTLSSGALSGLLLGLDVLTRTTIAPFAALAPLWLIGRKRTGAGVLCGLLLVLTVFPWMWRSYEITGRFVLSTEAGLVFWHGNNGFLFNHYPQESSDLSESEAWDALPEKDKQEFEQIGPNEALQDHWYFLEGLAYIRAHPWLTFTNGFRKIAAAFSWLPSPRHGFIGNVVYAISYGPVMLLGLWGMWLRRSCWREDSLIYALFGVFVLETIAFFAATSHRSFLDVYWVVFAAGVLAQAPLVVRESMRDGEQPSRTPGFETSAKHWLLVIRYVATGIVKYTWQSLRNFVRLLSGRKPLFNDQLLFFRQYLLHKMGIRPIQGITFSVNAGPEDSEIEGAASQAQLIMNAINFARASGLTYVHTPFTVIGHADRPMCEWVAAWETLFNLGVGEIAFDSKRRDVANYCLANWEGIHLCFGWEGLIRREQLTQNFRSLIPDFRRKYYWNKTPRVTDLVTVAVHVRRGDVPARNAGMFTRAEIILQMIKSVKSILASHDVCCSVRLYSEGNIADFAEFSPLVDEFFLDAEPLWTLQELVEADILIMAKSCFSFYAGTISDGIKIFEREAIAATFNMAVPSWRLMTLAPSDDWLPCGMDGSFDHAAFERRLSLLILSKKQSG